MIEKTFKELQSIVSPERVLRDEAMSRHTTFRVGGPCDIFVSVENIKEAENVIRLLSMNGVPYFVIGNGSNLLVCDEGYRGVIVEIGKNFAEITVNGNEITACAGALLVKVANEAAKAELTGLEFASGIPGTIGGGIYMNAGAYGGELKDVVKEVTVLNMETGEILVIPGNKMDFSYRHSIAKEKPYLILKAVLCLEKGNLEDIRSQMEELRIQRTTKQPLEFASAGSTFKRPEGYFAGKLIQDSGLKGYTVGGAQVSEKHSGFVINRGNATANDILTLIKDVQKVVDEKFGVSLETEVIILK